MASVAAHPVVFVVDDDASIRAALRRLFDSVGQSCELFESAAAFLVRADEDPQGCLVLDVRMPGMTGVELQHVLTSRGIDIPIVFVTAYADVPMTVRMMKAGAVEVLTKPFEDQRLLEAVAQAIERDRTQRLRKAEIWRDRERFETLTAREREVMALIVAGLLNKQVATVLGTSEKTVKVHRGQVMHKMQAASFAELVRMAGRLGLSEPGRPLPDDAAGHHPRRFAT
jgi:FixJ family two-component response regulator